MESIVCRSCGREMHVRRAVRLAERFTCPACGARLEVIGVSPVEVDWAFEPPLPEVTSELVVEDWLEDGDPAVA